MRIKSPFGVLTTAFLGVAALALGTSAHAQVVPFIGSGANPAAIQGTVDSYRTTLGTLNANVAGSFGSGRREINWDGVPATASDPNAFPGNFFNVNSPRGVVFSTPGSGFLVSAASGGATPTAFGFPSDFQTFSPQKLFAPVNSVITDISFFVPGSTTPAAVTGFGAVFTDVEVANLTNIQYFAQNGSLISQQFAPVTGNFGLAFVGITSTTPIFSVRITTGNQALLSNGSLGAGTDAVVMDDFIYSEPIAVAPSAAPEPGTLALLTLGGLGMVGVVRRRCRR
jgi:hypothetical protein